MMEFRDTDTVKSIALSFVFAVIGLCVWVFVDWVWLKPKKLENLLRKEGFSGNSYKLLHGDTKEMFMVSKEAKTRPVGPVSHDIGWRILPFHHRIISNYGKNSFFWLGPTPSINITDPKLIREIMLRYEIFQKPNRSPLSRLVFNGMVMYEGEQWFKVRKIANPAFHLDKLKDMPPKMYLSCNEMIRKWQNSITNKEFCELDVWSDIKTLTADVISRTAFGSSFEDGRKIFTLMTEQMSLLNQIFYFFHIPGWRFLPTQANRKLKSNNREIIELIKGIIKKREEALKVGETSYDDLLGLLVESNHREIQEHGNKESGMSIEEVIEECKLFYLAGQETTATLIGWTMVLLCMHQNWQDRAREEAFQVFGNKEPQFEELNRLKELNKILHEALRLYPPAALTNRVTTKEFKLGGVKIPSGVLISLPIILVHHDEEYWGADAKEFNPDRFSKGVSKASKNDQVSFFPFGWGPRICIGQNFALLEAKLALTMILQNFSFQFSPTYVHAPARGITIQPQHGAYMVLRKI
ncbi:cytochrome P450 CYP72A219-like [Mangifera indica]|uniref:cytochrome P450 CYP72A219-like n=1 Tax=Mangifera indica TaxID=29780 RepID=UPI001CFB25FE|nr:cytochrome P450 CYP72A219-like [Mangifera indica]